MQRFSSLPAFALGVSFAHFTGAVASAQEVQVGGFFSNGYIESSQYNYLADSHGGSFDFVEAGLNLSWTPRDRTTINAQLFAFELGPYGNFEPLIDYLFVDYNFSRELGVRAGRIKRELGIYYHIQDIDMSRTSILLPMGIYDQRFRDMSAALDGVSVYGNVDLWHSAYMDYTVYAGRTSMKDDGGIAGFALTTISRTATNPLLEHIASDRNYGGQLWISPGIEGLRIGAGSTLFVDIDLTVSGVFPLASPIPMLANLPFRTALRELDYRITHLSFDYFLNNWNFVGEIVTIESEHSQITESGGLAMPSERKTNTSDGWYVSAARRFGPLEAAFAYTEYHDGRTPGNGKVAGLLGTTYNKDSQFSLSYELTDNWILKTEIHSIEGTNRLFNELNQNPELNEEAWTLFAAKSTFFF